MDSACEDRCIVAADPRRSALRVVQATSNTTAEPDYARVAHDGRHDRDRGFTMRRSADGDRGYAVVPHRAAGRVPLGRWGGSPI